MLLDLKAPLAAGTTLPLTLQLRDAKGATTALDVQVTVRALNGGAMGQGMGHGPRTGVDLGRACAAPTRGWARARSESMSEQAPFAFGKLIPGFEFCSS
jgi:hypothetical protein